MCSFEAYVCSFLVLFFQSGLFLLFGGFSAPGLFFPRLCLWYGAHYLSWIIVQAFHCKLSFWSCRVFFEGFDFVAALAGAESFQKAKGRCVVEENCAAFKVIELMLQAIAEARNSRDKQNMSIEAKNRWGKLHFRRAKKASTWYNKQMKQENYIENK